MDKSIESSDPWKTLRGYTSARIGLGRAGSGMPTGQTLEFKLAHARARDAVHAPLDVAKLENELQQLGLETVHRQSRAQDRGEYLRRPDLGRQLGGSEFEPGKQPDLALVVADGLSALAIERHATNFLREFLPLAGGWSRSAIQIVTQARVAIGDEIGWRVGAKGVIVLIGERPGLSSPDSLGIYYTYAPVVGLTDERRNCISNVHRAGISYADAARTLCSLIEASFRQQLSGVRLKLSAFEPQHIV